MKRSFFQAAVTLILLYGCTTWTLTKRLETQFLPGSGCVDTAIWMHYMDANEAAGEETRRKLLKNVESSIKQVLATTPHETPTIRTLAPHHENYTSQTNQTRGTLLEKQGRAHKRCTPVDPHIWMCKSRTTSTNLHTATM